jgi:GTP-binding protein
LALSKADLVPPERSREAVAEWSGRLGEWSESLGGDVPVIATSAATGAGLAELGATLLRLVPVGERVAAGQVAEVAASSGNLAEPEQLAEHMVFRPAERTGFKVERVGEGAFAVRGPSVERLLQRFDVENDDAMAYVEGRLRRLGVLRALQDEGFQPGDELQIAGVVLELDAAE